MSLIAKLIQLDNDRHMWSGKQAAFYVKSRFTPREVKMLKRQLSAGKHTLQLYRDLGNNNSESAETIEIEIPASLVKAVREV